MKSVCCICSDLFDDTSAVAAVTCGHTFHYVCISRWLENKKTCPHCRKPVNKNGLIAKLFFDKADDDVASSQAATSARVANELSDLRVKVQVVEKERDESVQTLAMLQQSLTIITDNQAMTEKSLSRETAENASLRKRLCQLEAQNTLVMEERAEIKKIRQKMAQMEMVERVLKDSESDVKGILSQHGDSQLATYCAALKREFEKTKQEKKSMKAELDDSRRKLIVRGQKQSDYLNTAELLKNQLKQSEEDLKISERERDFYKRKYEQVKKSARFADLHTMKSSNNIIVMDATDNSPSVKSNLVTSISTPQGKLNNISPPPSTDFAENAFSPSLFDDSLNQEDNDDSIIEFAPTEVVKTPDLPENFRSRLKKECENVDMSFVEFNKPADNQTKVVKKRKIDEASENLSLSTLNIFKNMKKKSSFCDYGSTIRTNYNGLGGHSTFTQGSRLKNNMAKGSLNHFLNKRH